MHLMSPRCNDKGNIKRGSIQQTQLFFPVFTLSLPHENSLHCFRKHFSGTWHSRHLPAVIAYYPFLIASRRPLFQGLAPTIQLVAESPALWSVYTQLSRKQGNSSSRQNYFARINVGNNGLLHPFPDPFFMGKDSSGRNSNRGHLSYSLFQDIEIMR